MCSQVQMLSFWIVFFHSEGSFGPSLIFLSAGSDLDFYIIPDF